MRKLGTGHELSPMRFLRGVSIVLGRGVVLFVFEDQFDQKMFDNGDDFIGMLGCPGQQAWGPSSTIARGCGAWCACGCLRVRGCC